MDLVWNKCNILYYLRIKYFGRVRNIIDRITKQNFNNAEFKFYYGISFILEGQLQKGLTELTSLQSDKDTVLAVLIALVFGHKSASSVDREMLHNLETKLKEERKQASALSFYYAGLFLSLAEKYEKAVEYINKALKKDSNNLDMLILKGWNDMCMSNGSLQMATLDCLELAYNKNNTHPLALLGLSKYKNLSKEYDEANLILDRLIVNSTNQVVPLMEKLQNEFAMQKWDAVYDTLERIFAIESDNILALQIRVFAALCKQADHIEAADQLNRFISSLEDKETFNGYIFHYNAQLFSKICNRSSTILGQVYKFAQYASELYPNNVEYLSEVGYQCLLQSKVKEALNFFKAACKLDSNSILALCGLTLCQMAESGSTEQVAQQVELLFEMQGQKKIPMLYLLSAKLNEKMSASAIPYLNDAIDTKLSQADRLPYNLDYIKELDPEFLLDVSKEYKKHLPKRASVIIGYLKYSPKIGNNSVNKCFELLETVCKACPGLIAAVFELAKLKFSFGFVSEAQKLTQQILDLDNTHSGGQMLLAQIYLQQEMFTKASQCLESCLSYNFKVKDSVMYNLLKGIVYNNMNMSQEALASFTTGLTILKSKSNTTVNKTFDADLSIVDRATLYMQIIELQSELGLSEAGITMQEAIQEFTYTSEEGRLLIVKADLALKKGDIDQAIDLLKEIKPSQPYYFQAHTKLAHIYLKEKNDKNMFTTCFKEVVSNKPMSDAHVLMGDAYMSIHEPLQAVDAYELALKENPKSIQVIRKMGSALLKMHEYEQALRHYENGVHKLNDDELRMDYIDLLIKLKRYDKVDSIIAEELQKPHNKERTTEALSRRVKLLQKQASTRELVNPTDSTTLPILTEAKELQTIVVKRMEIDRNDVQDERQRLSSVLCCLAKLKAEKEPATAAILFSEALLYSPRNAEILLALAKLHAQMNNTQKCEQTLDVLLSSDPNNESAAVMRADLAFRKVDFETAQRHLTQILSVKPTAWDALAQLIEVQWRRGKLTDAEPLLEGARVAMGDDDDPGYKYCAGILSAYNGRPNAALRLLNQCRGAARWGPAAARRMALLCLSQRTAADDGQGDDGDTRLLALRTAEKLVSEVPLSERKAVQALVLVASRQKGHAERVLQDLQPYVTEEAAHDDPYIILAVATAYNILKQPTRAKNILKRSISSMVWTPENADGLERCWLEVAESQINSGRTDAAKEMLTKILTQNNSCASAYQSLGFIAEKEPNYKAAVQNYDNAWQYTGKTNLALGYKLAHAYLKLKKYPECIVVCRHILSIHPDYPKIKKEVLEKAKLNLRS